ncbi:hypothetical protein Calab_0152 [Caldithrix abyssi DSM 13497]|uniref:Uncharacterized protein n=1 Tax=Caldithrix abyssi DSM 13497 TaxID=880073 RepID=H1XYI7_CALAY|nr:hypothetical protein Calab_0152 [Caldithrix abyssi DSM 13497]
MPDENSTHLQEFYTRNVKLISSRQGRLRIARRFNGGDDEPHQPQSRPVETVETGGMKIQMSLRDIFTFCVVSLSPAVNCRVILNYPYGI